jgi:hypothetical protein
MLARGVAVSYETIRRWCAKFGRAHANQLRRRRPRLGDKWHLDEVLVKINGITHYLCRAVDQHGNVLDFLVQSRRSAKAATRFLRKLLNGLRNVPRIGDVLPGEGLVDLAGEGALQAAEDVFGGQLFSGAAVAVGAGSRTGREPGAGNHVQARLARRSPQRGLGVLRASEEGALVAVFKRAGVNVCRGLVAGSSPAHPVWLVIVDQFMVSRRYVRSER